MKSLPLVGGALLALLLSLPASAGAMRCKNALITEGDSTAEMLLKCGEPMLREELTRNEENQFGNLMQVKYGERWTYNFGKNEFMRFVTVRNGVITDIENGPRGGSRRAKTCMDADYKTERTMEVTPTAGWCDAGREPPD